MAMLTEVRERPVLFSGPMVRAILEGRKTQTRRVVKLPRWSTGDWDDFEYDGLEALAICEETGCQATVPCPYGQSGDRLWVREAFFDHGDLDGAITRRDERIEYRAEPWDRMCDDKDAGPWRPSIHMPRWASRLTLEITDVRVERVQAITREDAIAEGVFEADAAKELAARRAITERRDSVGPRDYFRALWDTINAARGYSFESNPWVWALTFRVLPTDGAPNERGE